MDEKTKSVYLKTIYLIEEKGGKATTLNIANQLKIKSASVTEMLQKLAKENYVSYSPYHGVVLTKKGARTAKKIIRKHRLLETFLKNTLQLSNKEVCEQAGHLGHSFSDNADQHLCIFLNRPKEGAVDHGNIPHCTKKISCGQCLKENYGKVARPNIF